MSTRSILLGAILGLTAFGWACDGRSPTLAGPSSSTTLPSPGVLAPDGNIHAVSGTHGEALTAIQGSGSGIVDVTTTAAVMGSFSAQINVSVHGAPPNTTFYVQRAPEIGRSNGADGVCQRAAGLPPWGPPTPNFVTFAVPGGPFVTLLTSEAGAGAAHIDFAAPTIPDGTQFDVMFRLVDSLTSPANELRTGCFTVTVK
jgi:hypothetical protein